MRCYLLAALASTCLIALASSACVVGTVKPTTSGSCNPNYEICLTGRDYTSTSCPFGKALHPQLHVCMELAKCKHMYCRARPANARFVKPVLPKGVNCTTGERRSRGHCELYHDVCIGEAFHELPCLGPTYYHETSQECVSYAQCTTLDCEWLN